MPTRRTSTRTTRRRRHTNATEKVIRNSKYRKSAKSQAKQIGTTARAVVRIQSQLRDNHNADLAYQINWANRKLTTNNTTTLGNVVILPLSSGPTANSPQNGATSNMPFINSQDPTICDMAWSLVQPISRSQADNRGPPSWTRIFRQNVKLAFHSNTLTSQVRYTLFVVRIARPEDGSDLDNTMLQRMNQMDGASGRGHPSLAADFARGEDFYAINGFLNPQGQTNTTVQGTDIPEGNLLPRMNHSRWKVIHKREFVLGPARANNNPNLGQTSQAYTQPGAVGVDNTSFYSCNFNINYGGALVKPSNIDSALTASNPISLNDYSYQDLNPKLKYWCVIFPSKHVRDVDPAPPLYQQGVPVVSLQSTISCKCPA